MQSEAGEWSTAGALSPLPFQNRVQQRRGCFFIAV